VWGSTRSPPKSWDRQNSLARLAARRPRGCCTNNYRWTVTLLPAVSRFAPFCGSVSSASYWSKRSSSSLVILRFKLISGNLPCSSSFKTECGASANRAARGKTAVGALNTAVLFSMRTSTRAMTYSPITVGSGSSNSTTNATTHLSKQRRPNSTIPCQSCLRSGACSVSYASILAHSTKESST